MSFHTFGQVIVVLNTANAAKDLLEKRSAIYSDRSVLPIHEMMGWDWILTFARSDDHLWRQGRRMLEGGLRPGATISYRSTIQARTHVFLSRLLETPHQWESHIDLFQGELILAVTYGYEVHRSDDRMVNAAKRLNQFGIEMALPGALLINSIPLLRHIPEWLPWFSYKPLARVGRELGNQVLHPPVRFVKESMLNGTARLSLALENLQELETLNLSRLEGDRAEEVIAGVLGSIYSAGTDTTAGVMKSFFLAMLLHPDTQRKSQEELDSVIGRDRLPTFEDRPRLPFVDAVCKETLRWCPLAPLSVPHAVTQDDVYEGFFIPKGAVVIPNTWAILHDPATYPEPDMFNPERFLNTDGSLRDDPTLISVFGYGKRICPGRHVADATLFMSITSLLSVFNIKKGRGGWDKLSSYTFTGALANYPNPFPCSFVPRDGRAQELILAHTMAR